MSSTSTLIQPGGKIYELTGEQSNKGSTARTRNSGLKQFNMFLQTKNVTIQFGPRNPEDDEKYKTAELENYFCNKKFWQEFGTYIKQDATPQSSNRDDNMFYPSTVYNYFGMAKERIRLIYPDNSVWPGHEWVHGSEQSDGWFSKIRDDVKKYVEDVRLKSGRSNKKITLPIGWVLYDNAYWNTIDNCFWVLWCEPKVSTNISIMYELYILYFSYTIQSV
jgi:hypothetical protein